MGTWYNGLCGICYVVNFSMMVDTEVCEQVFSCQSKYCKMTQKMSQHTFLFFLFYLCDLHNIREESKLVQATIM